MVRWSAQKELTEFSETGEFRAKELELLNAAGFVRVMDLLVHLPRRYEDRRRFDRFPAQAGGDAVCLQGTVVDSSRRRFGGNRQFYEVKVQSQGDGVFENASIHCRWFNMPYISKILAAGHEVVLFGKVKEVKGQLVIDHPEFEVIHEDSDESVHLERIVPVYRNVSGIAQRRLREIIYKLLSGVDVESLAWHFDVDPSYPRADVFQEIHFPGEREEAEAARRFLALEEFFLLQLNVVWRRAKLSAQMGRSQGGNSRYVGEFLAALPFQLTSAQKRSIEEVREGMQATSPMNRLLQGDVGSGKTFVALCAALYAVGAGSQVALMAPTQILAEQHYLTFSKWLEPLGVRVSLHTSARSEHSGIDLIGKEQVVIGTHALLYAATEFTSLGLVIIDEQHKFGVEQRGRLIELGRVPDVLAMTATPIPRTLTQTIYGDMDVSIIDELPAGRGKIITGVRVKPKVSDVTKFIKQNLEQGRQAYIVYPLVEESDSLEAGSVVVEVEKWRKRLAKHEVGLLHGKLSAEEKDAVMDRFRRGEINVLVATTVVEVGVDVPNANLMMVYNAERFGLAQLHQLRGRIGRGQHKSYCILATDGKSVEALEKLEVLAATADGFEIAEADLALRGPGEVLGTQQSGISQLRFPEFLTDMELVREARALAQRVISEGANLENYPDLLAEMELGETG